MFFFFFFFDNEKKLQDKQIELHYLSKTISYGIEKNDGNEFFDSYGVLEKQNSKDESDNEFKESDFKRLISEKIRKTIYGEKYSNIVFLAGAGASVVGGNPNYGKTVKMIADDIFKKLHDTDKLYTLEELAEIRKRTDLEIEAFVHGAMCISYSGRCTLSNHMSDRDANRGGCSQSCRWKYDLYDMPFGQERKSIHGEVPEEYSMSAVDMCMIENIPDLIDNGVDSLKIEGRMKSVHYVSTVANCYKAACDAYMESAEAFYAIKDDLINELWKVAQRELATGFYYKTPTENEQLFGARRKIPQYKFVGEVVDFDPATMTATIRQRNVILEGDHVEFYGPGFRHFECDIKDLHDANGNKIDRAPNPMELLTITVPQEVKPGDMIRSTKEGLINLYQKDGSSKTVRA